MAIFPLDNQLLQQAGLLAFFASLLARISVGAFHLKTKGDYFFYAKLDLVHQGTVILLN